MQFKYDFKRMFVTSLPKKAINFVKLIEIANNMQIFLLLLLY